MWTRAGVGVGAAAVITVWASIAASAAGHPPAPRGPQDPLRAGCQRTDGGVLSRTSPEWVYVDRRPAIRRARGTVRDAYVSPSDEPLAHAWFDFSADVVLRRADRWLLGGDPARRTGNFHDRRRPPLHVEWESGALPPFAWPTTGDRTEMWGSWIWDCAHWTDSPVNAPGSAVTGEETELHPLDAIVVYRHAPFRPSRAETQTDVFISTSGTQAHAVERCALTHGPVAPDRYDPGFHDCSGNPALRRQHLAHSYGFRVPAPPRPPGIARLRWHASTRVAGSRGRERVRVGRNGLEVTVAMPRGQAARYGRSFYVSWSRPQPRPARVRVTLQSIVVRHADPSGARHPKTPAAWNLYLDLNGSWRRIDDWAPGLSAVVDGSRIPIHHSVTIDVPHGAGLRLAVSGRECDIPGGTVVAGTWVPVLHPCPPNDQEVSTGDDPGTVSRRFRSVRDALGTWTGISAQAPGSSQGAGDFLLRYSIRFA